jgi:capsular exopolysaccharide synthesis family protein
MSKIFSALTKSPGEIADLSLSVMAKAGQSKLLDEKALEENGTAAGSEPAAVNSEASPEATFVAEQSTIPPPLNQAGSWAVPPPLPIAPVSPGWSAEPEEEEIPEVKNVYVDPGHNPVLPFAEDKQSGVAAEQYRVIRTRILQHPARPRVTLITSPGPGDGKSVSSVNIAGAMALRSSVQVLLIDADLRRSNVATLLRIPHAPGLADVLSGRVHPNEAIVRVDQSPNLFIMPAGDIQANPAELLHSQSWKSLIPELKEQYDHIIIDGPPVHSGIADYELIEAVGEGVVMVLRPDVTHRSALQEALKLVTRKKLLGVVLNHVEDWFLWRPSTYYSYTYLSKPKSGVKTR